MSSDSTVVSKDLEQEVKEVGSAIEHIPEEIAQGAAHGDDPMADVVEWVGSHLADSYSWHLPGGLNIPLDSLPMGFSLHALMLVIASLIISFLFVVVYRKNDRVPTGITNLLETLVVFVRDEIAIPNVNHVEDGKKLTPLLCTFFFLILTLNLMGLIPLFVTATANPGVTLGLATITFAVIVFGGIIKSGPVGFIKAFIPHGVPLPILFILTPLEMLGVVIKTAALTIRLFANLLAGHIVVYVFVGLIVVFGVFGTPAFFLALGINLLEVLVAFIQAYVFTLLSAMFIGQVWHPDH